MTSFLWMISFLLHIILMYAVYSLFKQVQAEKNARKEEIESLLTEFMHVLHEENNHLIQLLKQEDGVKEAREKATYRTDTVQEDHTMEEQKTGEKLKEDIRFGSLLQKMIEKEQDKVETSSEARMIQMYQAGKSIEEIARAFDRGKTEVELIVKLHKN
ncbi:DUF6115 domain-containing protein [Pseudogracilibacillus sp. ICA-222130]|uniref:DUF6115 domain-containing protein n=1 Tax=Pseudogracilibacillus sp. ICA-222130 TaxID=3134655 RepID=UPI0030BBA1D4